MQAKATACIGYEFDDCNRARVMCWLCTCWLQLSKGYVLIMYLLVAIEKRLCIGHAFAGCNRALGPFCSGALANPGQS